MKKYFVIISALLLFSLCSNAQSTRRHIEKALTDPKAAENAAKADAMLIDKKKVTNRSDSDTIIPAAIKDNPCLNKRKKKSSKRTQ